MRRILWILLLAGTMITEVAAQQNDSTIVDKGFDATDRAFLKRYRYPDAVPFDTVWKNNIYLTLFGGVDRLIPQRNANFKVGGVGGIGANWQFAPAHALRASLLVGNFARNIDNEILIRLGLQADYMLNVTTYTKGYNPGRFFEFLTVLGLGYQASILEGKMEHVGELHVGAQFKFHPDPQLDFFVEPRVTLMSDGIDHSEQSNWHKYDMTYGLIVGLNYRFKAWKPLGGMKTLNSEHFLDNTFISIAGGGQMQLSGLTKEIGLMKSVGPHFSLSVGKWLIPAFALRLSGFKSGDTWHKRTVQSSGEEYYEMSTYAGGRLEGMLNATYFLNGHNEDSPFSVNVLAGGEIGVIKKESGYIPARGAYTGFTGGLQLKYRLFDDVAIFIEPRGTLASYRIQTNQKVDGRYVAEKYTDNLASLNFGIEIRRSSEENRLARSIHRGEFVPSFFASVAGGFAIPMQVKRYDLKHYFSYNAMAAAGRIFTPLSTVRAGLDFGPITVDRRSGTQTYNMGSISLDYMLNLGNLMMGYAPERKYDIQLLAGIVGTMRMKPSGGDDEKSRFLLGMEAGAQVSYKITPLIKIFVEPKIRFYGKKMLSQSNTQKRDMLMSMQLGGSYAF